MQLYSIDQAPRDVPIWPVLMDELCSPRPTRVARVLGISTRTVRRYNRTGQAPRAICLALFWLTSWGRSQVHTQAHNDAVLAIGYVRSLRESIEHLEATIRHLESIGHFGAANEPLRMQPGPSRPGALPGAKKL
jgi:hypothetical protein